MDSLSIEKWTNYIKDCKARLDQFNQIIHCPFQYVDTFQSMPKKFPNHRNISAFALYLGSYANYDLYSNLANDSEFYSGIYVFGDEDHEYGSGNFVSLLDTSGHFDIY